MDSQDKYQVALEHHQKNRLDEAKKIYLEILKNNENDHLILFLIGTLLIQKEEFENAISYLTKAVKIKNDSFEYNQNLGIACINIKDFSKAKNYLENALRINPSSSDTYNNLGNVSLSLNQKDQALTYYNKALSINSSSEVLFNRAKLFYELNYINEAIEDLKKINESDPVFISSCQLLAKIFCILEKNIEAYELLESLVRKNPSNIQIKTEFIDLCIKLEKYEYIDREIKLLIQDGHKQEALFLEANLAFKKNDFKKSKKLYEKYISICPENIPALNNLSLINKELGDKNAVLDTIEKIFKIDPKNSYANFSKSLIDLYDLKFYEGWKGYDKRINLEYFKDQTHAQFTKIFSKTAKKWHGENTKTSVLIYCEQGVGDQVFFLKFLGYIKNFQNHFYVSINSKLINIYKYNYPQFNFISSANDVSALNPDYYCSIIDLGKIFIKSYKDLALAINPIKIKNKLIAKKNKKTCGISWYTHKRGAIRNIDLDNLMRNLPKENFRYLDLQYGDFHQKINGIKSRYKIEFDTLDHIDKFNDLDQLFSYIASCDYVITITNSLAHFAGALGIKTFLLIPNNYLDWRYSSSNNICHWYPNTILIPYNEHQNFESLNKFLK